MEQLNVPYHLISHPLFLEKEPKLTRPVAFIRFPRHLYLHCNLVLYSFVILLIIVSTGILVLFVWQIKKNPVSRQPENNNYGK